MIAFSPSGGGLSRSPPRGCNRDSVLLLWHGSPEGHPRLAPGYFTLKASLLYPLHAIVIRLHRRNSYVVILIAETANLLGLREVAGLIGRKKNLVSMRLSIC